MDKVIIPAMLNFNSPWEDGISPYDLMHIVHDLWQLNHLNYLKNRDRVTSRLLTIEQSLQCCSLVGMSYRKLGVGSST